MKRHGTYFVYILHCADNSYYTGYTRDLDNRVKQHESGNGAKFTKYRLPVRLVYFKLYKYYENALKAEKRLKHMTRKRKENIIRIFQDS
ncbi:MAG: GIY-YIG nuclease family protein [Candidatus Omnitrophica bacterium]|nr:GIY-YIG nuclease family protein [Candidatus Omnitrophota bacterium]